MAASLQDSCKIASGAEVSDPILSKVQSEQRQDEELRMLIDYRLNKRLPIEQKTATAVSNLAQKGYCLVNGVLYYKGLDLPGKQQLVVPHHLRKQLVNENHDAVFAGHFSTKKMQKKITQLYFWLGMFIRSVCVMFKNIRLNSRLRQEAHAADEEYSSKWPI